MDAKCQFLPKHRLIIEVIRGDIDLAGMISTRQTEIENGWIQPGVNTLVVVGSDSISLTPHDLRQYFAWAKENLAPITGSKTAILVDSPLETAFSELLRDLIASIRVIKVFCTLYAAADWLEIPAADIQSEAPDVLSLFER